eukprot:CAMPEP_0198248510 /NCGR_PEP_ID=MMETSP1447-20131203/259_1 /TAXON_ID=420782 /ORGANISM="Chaetoceros dichaeta, Strain CCMP1751" /LENGTH=1219 /DNA_ID=CAMNT_0043932919 /DNA_START=97 /DNA_END=3756 /DNA_ORIENTATION=+
MSSYQDGSGPAANYAPNDSRPRSNRTKWVIAGAVGISAMLVYTLTNFSTGRNVKVDNQVELRSSPAMKFEDEKPLKLFDSTNRYVMEDFDAKPTFASFLPAVAGLYGIPVWSFYVNRGQAIASFGFKSKEFPILEYNAANKAYQDTPYVGFRTFLKGTRDGEDFFTEPFSPRNARNLEDDSDQSMLPKRVMFVGPNECEIKETDRVNGLITSVKYIVLPEDTFGALVRRTNITNSGNSPVTFSALDGLAKLEPVGGKLDWSLKNMGRTLEGWMGVYQAGEGTTMPFYRMSTEPGDSAAVKIELAGHYLLSFLDSPDHDAELLPIVYDSEVVFGRDTSLFQADGFKAKSMKDILSNPQYGDARTSSGFAALNEVTLQPGESLSIASFYGKADHIEGVKPIADHVTKAGYVERKFNQARVMIDSLTSSVETNTSSHLFDGTVKQVFLDNSLRGGMPFILGDLDDDAKYSNYDEDERVKVFHAFSRIHGDLERDYNAFFIDDTYFSQGHGNFRDVAQNRRDDVTFTPRIGSFDVQMFLSFIQADAYEPLTVEAVTFTVKDPAVGATIASECTSDTTSATTLTNVLNGGPFRPGQLLALIEELNIVLKVPQSVFLDRAVAASEDLSMATFGQGYWGDHWDYYLDLIHSYLAIYPDGEESLMYDKELRYFFSTATIKPRSEKYVLQYTFDGKGHHVLQLESTVFDKNKEEEQEAFRSTTTGILGTDAYWQRTPNGGEAFTSAPIAKLFLLGATKFATRDAYGMGVEYEGGRPGWNDAMNGLPGMVGSGMPETYEMYQLLNYVKKVVTTYERPVVIPTEFFGVVNEINAALDTLDSSGFEEPEATSYDVPQELFTYWNTVATARETYRAKVEYYFSGDTSSMASDEVVAIIDRWLAQIDLGMSRAIKFGSQGDGDDGTSGIPPSYFHYIITQWERNGKSNDVGLPHVNALAMQVGRFPLFLEGPTRYLKTVIDDKAAVSTMYQKVKKSGLRDEALKMYYVSASLKGQSYDMGRMMAFTPGWLENQSIWMHMSYKYYLELLRGKLYVEFFDEMRGGGMLPFMDPVKYGRSLMECSSFLASSAFSDPSYHGRGFSARLSGSTAEFLSMWKLIFIGQNPYFIDENDGTLKMHLKPAIPAWMFEDDGENAADPTYDEDGYKTVSFKLFAHIPVTYHNSKGSDLFGIAPDKYKVTMADGEVHNVQGSVIPTNLAVAIRKLYSVQSIDAYF